MSAYGERITNSFDWWLREEALQARQSRNKVLDNFHDLRRSYLLPYGHPDNLSLSKAASHHNRFVIFMRALARQEIDLSDDRVPARIIHHSLMFAAGAARISAALKTAAQDEYEAKRFRGRSPYDVDIQPVVEHELRDETWWLHANSAVLATRGIVTASKIANRHTGNVAWFGAFPERAYARHYPIAEPVERVQDIQRLAVGMAVATIIVTAYERDIDITNVPFFEPKSITDVGAPIYPLRNQFEYEGDSLELHGRATIAAWSKL